MKFDLVKKENHFLNYKKKPEDSSRLMYLLNTNITNGQTHGPTDRVTY